MGIYMKFGDVAGEATQRVQSNTGVGSQVLRMVAGSIAAALLGDTGWIPLKSFQWNATRDITSRAGNGSSSGARGPVTTDVHDVVVDKDVDGSSPDLLEKFDNDTKGVDCAIVFIRTGDPGEIYLQYRLKNTLIKSITHAGREDRPNEQLVFTFTEMEVTAWCAEEDNVGPGGQPSRHTITKDPSQHDGHHGHDGDHHHGPHR
jgi:type VI protein secretion system component Hcp